MSKIKQIRKEHSLSTLFIANMVNLPEDEYIEREKQGVHAFTDNQREHLTIVFGVDHDDLHDTPVLSIDESEINRLKNYRKMLNERIS